jgi:hypothetical protein
MRRLTASLAASALLAGCQSSLSPGQIAALEYGSPPEDYEKIVRDYLRPRLGEPNFALIEIKAGPSRLYQRETISREPQHGWAVCVMINERDPRGGYTGFYPMVIYIRGEKSSQRTAAAWNAPPDSATRTPSAGGWAIRCPSAGFVSRRSSTRPAFSSW